MGLYSYIGFNFVMMGCDYMTLVLHI